MSYRQGQIDALCKIGFLRTPGQAVAANALAGAALGGGAGAALDSDNRWRGGITGAVLGGGAGAIGKNLRNEAYRKIDPEYVLKSDRYDDTMGEFFANTLQHDMTHPEVKRLGDLADAAHADITQHQFSPEIEQKLKRFY